MLKFADHIFKFDENGRKLSKRVENTVGKGEIARYEQFLLFPQCFQKAFFPGASKGVIVWEWVNISKWKGILSCNCLQVNFGRIRVNPKIEKHRTPDNDMTSLTFCQSGRA